MAPPTKQDVNPFEQMHAREEAKRHPTPRAVVGRIKPLPSFVDVGEQVIGSDHLFDLAALTIVDGFLGRVYVHSSVEAMDAHNPLAPLGPQNNRHGFLPETGDMSMPLELLTGANPVLRSRFKPTRPGLHKAVLRFVLRWEDGGMSDHVITLQGRAREIVDIPGDRRETETPSRPRTDEPTPEHEGNLTTSFGRLQSEANRARDATDGLGTAQEDGIKNAESESASFKEHVPQGPWWAGLADLAISMGVAGIAGVFARQLAHTLSSPLNPAMSDSELRNSRIFVGLNDAMKEGMKGGAKKNLPSVAARRGEGQPAPAAQAPEGFSSNPRIDFWARQRHAVSEVKGNNRDLITSVEAKLQRDLPHEPAVAVHAMRSVTETLVVISKRAAVLQQQFASETQWMSGIAQAGLGSEEVDVGSGTRSVSNLNYVRKQPDSPFIKQNGLLKLSVRLPAYARLSDAAGAKVSGASIRGVSQEIADQIWTRPLIGVAIPILIEVHWGEEQTTITVDETGRVRVDGRLPGEPVDAEVSEAQHIRDATTLTTAVLSRSLEQWGLPQVKTNDAGGRGD